MADLDPRLTFETFVVGTANRLASAAARSAAENPGLSYNPLFIYSGPGLGKTHLLGAIGQQCRKAHPDLKIEYQTLEDFLGDLTGALKAGNAEDFKGRYQGLDVLLLDDVQFLRGQPQAQEMLLRALDALTKGGKQVVLTSDRPPAEMDNLDARLQSRFAAGLMVDIGPPDLETRVAIVKKKAEARNQALGDHVAEAIGRIGYRNVRELSGALNRILAVQELEGRTVSLEEASEILAEAQDGTVTTEEGELGTFLQELTDSVAETVAAHEAPWRRSLRDLAESVEAEGFKAEGLRRIIRQDSPPEDLMRLRLEFDETVFRLKEIKAQLDAVGNPWPEAAFGVLRDPERIEEAEALLASARERARPFPEVPPGPALPILSRTYPQLVLRAAELLVRTDRPEYNPLFVWSPGGEAASVLLQAAARTQAADKGSRRVALVSLAGFSEDFVRALSEGVAGAWRERWWSADLLLVHGIQHLSETERAQEEFFHLFEALQRRKGRIMVASDRPPSEIGNIDERLRSRFEGGLVLEIGLRPSDLPSTLRFAEVAKAKKRGPEEEQLEVLGTLDREWIRSFRPPAAVHVRRRVHAGLAAASKPTVATLPVPGTAAGDREAWFPSPEKVIWEWPRPEERIVEGLS